MIRVLILVFMFCCAFNTKAQQNMILNPSCEEASSIPNNLAQYSLCVNWWKPYIWSTDYFTTLTNEANNNNIPFSRFGFQGSISGNYYLGIALCSWFYTINDFSPFRHDYAAGQFTETLEKDKIYQFEFWMSKADSALFKTNAIDVVLTYDTIVDVNNYEYYGYKIWSEETPMTDTVNWVKISTCFKAKGNEKAFAIGNFHEPEDVIKIFSYDPSSEVDYRYLDNFSLIECPTCCPEQFPDEQQVFVYSNPSSGDNPANILIWLHPETTANLEIYDSAGRLVDRRSFAALQNTYTFKEMAAGLYHFVVTSSDGLEENGKVLVAE